MNITVILQYPPSLEQRLAVLSTQLGAIMANLQDLTTEVATLKTVDASVVALLTGLSARIAALEPNQAAIDQLAADIKTETDTLTAAVTANTPAA